MAHTATATHVEAAVTLLMATKPLAQETLPSERVNIGRKGNRITIDVDADLAPRVEAAVRKLVIELLDRGQDGPVNVSVGWLAVATSPLRDVQKPIVIAQPKLFWGR